MSEIRMGGTSQTRSNFPWGALFGFAVVGFYITFTMLAISQYPLKFSPLDTYLSMFGNAELNPLGASYYTLAMILTGLAEIPFFIAIYVFYSPYGPKWLLAIGLLAGLVNGLAVVMSGINSLSVNENAHVAWSLTIFYSFLPMLLAFNLVFWRMNGASRSIGVFGFVVCIIDMAFLAALLSGHTAPLGSTLEWASVFSFLAWIALISMNVLARSRAESQVVSSVKKEPASIMDPPRRSQIGVLAGIVLITMLVLIALLVPRLQEKGLYQVPPETGDGWATASLSQVGMDQQPIDELLSKLAQDKTYNIHSLLVVKDGKLVLETYYPGEDISATDKLTFPEKNFDRDTLHCLASASKSVTSILVGIAIDQGKISGVDEKMFASFPDYAVLSDEGKDQITLQQMLTMTSGIPWDESYPYTDKRNDITHMLFFSPDPIRYVLEKELTNRPGEAWVYNSGTTNLLGEIVHRSTGIPLAEYAKDSLFQPLGITSYQWLTFRTSPDMAVASSLLYLKPRDMAKIGQLYLQEGNWNGKQLVTHHWVQESTANSVVFQQPPIDFGPSFKNTGYGYQWWRGKFVNGNTDTIIAAGFGSQFILIMPEINTVVVTTGLNNDYSKIFDMINNDILGSIYGAP